MELAKFSRNQLLLGALGLALLVTPYLACSSSESASSEASTSTEELQSKLLGTWQGSAEIDNETIPFSLSLDQRGATSTPERLTVVGSLTSENPSFDGAVDGYFGIDATNHRVTLSLRLDDGKTLLGTLEGEALSDGRIVNMARTGTFGLGRP